MEKENRFSTALIAALLLSFIPAFIFDREIATSVSSLQSSFLNQIMVVISYLGIFSVLFIIIMCLFIVHEKEKIMPLRTSFIITTIAVLLLKIIVDRARPFDALGLETLKLLIYPSYLSWDLSFPSFHASWAFSILPFFRGKLKYCWLVFAVLVAFSRIFFALHYLSDVIAGALIGYTISMIFIKIFKLKQGIIK